eukprot:CAMPEP_0204830706 /NCGR_PEP_ID=MMETSP1346-20131115/9136_1 /ASSEMBLY_ACC=CAM_ASM_000771 /TAXON_ID=215587 /ORGANISM="Aplanochytrium stocchinoi, Strain GSBS06" /LENGTH=423 /DNA_ID=CAMNT_0051961197 /DNA_START=395 /DNA_END=1663 /DNA_ORIENTATION=+
MWTILKGNYGYSCSGLVNKKDAKVNGHESNVDVIGTDSDEELSGDLGEDIGEIVEESEYELGGGGKNIIDMQGEEYESSGDGESKVDDKDVSDTNQGLDNNAANISTHPIESKQNEETGESAKKTNCAIGICGNHYEDARDVLIKEGHDSKEDAHSKALSQVSMFNDETGTKKLKVFVHIPKTAGSSIIRDGMKGLHNLLQGNFERSYYTLYEKDAVMLSFFREPRAHVYSQFMHCKYNPYGTHRNYDGFKKSSNDAKGDSNDFEFWLDHFNNPKFQMVDFKTKSLDPINTAWDCYNPVNMQARYMTSHCHDSKQCHQGSKNDALEPPLVEAIQNLENLQWFGLTELYEPSLCMLIYQSKGHLPKFCDCNSDIHKARQKNLHHVTHKIHKHDVNRLNLRIKRKIDHITRIDQQLYNHAKDIFM